MARSTLDSCGDIKTARSPSSHDKRPDRRRRLAIFSILAARYTTHLCVARLSVGKVPDQLSARCLRSGISSDLLVHNLEAKKEKQEGKQERVRNRKRKE